MITHNILIVIVLYEESLFSCTTYKTLIDACKCRDVYIYDNSPQSCHTYDDFPSSWKYISDTTNPGLSYAYNRAAEYAKKNGYEWMLLTDQDTIFSYNIIEKYINAINNNQDIMLFAPQFKTTKDKWFSPVRLFHNINLHTNMILPGRYALKNYSPINSGMVINVDAYMQVGGYNESVFLDYSDFQFIEKFKQKYPHFFLLDAVCEQNFSNEIQSKRQKYNRFHLFCRSLRNFQCDSMFDKLGIHFIVIKRCISLSLQYLSVTPISIMVKNYLKK